MSNDGCYEPKSWLRNRQNADILSDMRTFTIRDLDRKPAAVLSACDEDGVVRVKRRDGRSYTLQREGNGQKMGALPDFKARRKAIFPKPISSKQAKAVDALLGGE